MIRQPIQVKARPANVETPGLCLRVVSIRIDDWDDDRAWATFTGFHRHDLERRLTRLTGLERTAIKRLARRLKRRECFTLPLPQAADAFGAATLRSFLESLGAVAYISAG